MSYAVAETERLRYRSSTDPYIQDLLKTFHTVLQRTVYLENIMQLKQLE